MGGWKFVVNFLLPPPLILTILLLIPFPQFLRKLILGFTKKFLFYPLGPLCLVHVALLISGLSFIGVAYEAHVLSLQQMPLDATPNHRTAFLAKKWREERNFWICCMSFLLWGLLYRFYHLLVEFYILRDRIKYLEVVNARVATPATTLRPPEPPSSNVTSSSSSTSKNIEVKKKE
uniref:BAP29/BAP31 transmembrane domain-containing protein n=1 Tax=Polytomella parva TaxID=51329 RepID=A0A7S0V5R6_9CHLO|mmetsp:Transcript_28450/g.52385  ORF Transcript_28450/g.52385 Transcript_28450/m.52385 type:complete len:176 (+) Transcript_28450:88-615(+)